MGLTAEQAATITDRMSKALQARRANLDLWEQYFTGQHPLAFASKEWAKFHADRYSGFSDNWCGVVGRAAPERRELYGLRLGDDVEIQSDDEKALWRDWEAVEGPSKASMGWLSSAYLSTSYSLVWGTADREPLLSWESPKEAIIDYDPETGAPRYGLKFWADESHDYATLYTPDELWKWKRLRSSLILPASFMALAGGWSPRGDALVETNPLGVLPLVEHPNRPLLSTGPISDIAGVVPMQKAVNLMWAYLFGAADYASMPARVVMGQEPPKMPILNEDGVKVGEQAVDAEALKSGRLLWLTGQNTKIGSWDAAKLDVFTGVVNVAVKHIASQTQTPIHYIMGELGNVNGETLTATELPLATKVRGGNKHLTQPVREIFRRFALVRGNKGLADAARSAVVQWKNPETMSDAQVSDAASKDKTIGWPFAAILERRYNLSQPEIARIQAMAEAEATDPTITSMMDKLSGSATSGL